jgi:hypothetical protein
VLKFKNKFGSLRVNSGVKGLTDITLVLAIRSLLTNSCDSHDSVTFAVKELCQKQSSIYMHTALSAKTSEEGFTSFIEINTGIST